ncbi:MULTISPECIES: DUF2919 family protein [unclassified Colwellia]|jgi:hypothetical protein|uniref:DUF2919 family protein n=1 Tax=unclassified Colwellia TaxID=196834 RepID=UPI000D3AB877|nr:MULTISPECIES: DUF2919 family protein [unclassified Colwellia]AWB57990.1 hypothetical protein DBO93_10690 [Colwellia sp. Arc7-D]MBA6417081.1 DUF2919 domain-containing protein [Colwellia sp. 6M3]|tara:strand:+ start:78 stop:611 length:534 start_codon:yes stop_codon:yes gene_type:complete
MSANNYAKFSPKHFDSFDCLTLAPGIYFILLFVLRAYIIWIMSVTNMRDNVGFIQWVYPQTALFYLNLASGVIGLFVVLILSLRRPKAPTWVRTCWQKCKTLLILALVFDLTIGVLGYLIWQLQSLVWIIMHCLLVISAITYILRSKRFTINIAEFPEVLPENNTRKHRKTKGLEID